MNLVIKTSKLMSETTFSILLLTHASS